MAIFTVWRRDEEANITRQRKLQIEMIVRATDWCGGRFVRAMDDGIFVEFPGLADEAKSGLLIQCAMDESDLEVSLGSGSL